MFAQESVMDIQEKQALQKLINEMHDVTGMWSVEQMVTHVWQAAKAQAVPEGFAVVPIEITPKQIEAYMKGKVFPASMGEHRKFVDRLSKDYKAMIKAQEPTND